MARNQLRGDAVNTYLKFVRKRWGQRGYEELLSALPLEGDVKPGLYYDDELVMQIYRWIYDRKGDRGLIDAGKFVPHNLGIIAWLTRFGSPDMVLKRVEKNFKEVYTFGKGHVDLPAKNEALITFTDIYAGRERCIVWKGILEGFLEICHARGTVEKIECQGEGGSACVYKVRWD